ncbi:MAG: DUF3987 domain-containing protein [Bacteroidaceae bacterium]|nr:DUF3987 domain-containing protein [Bacteroidaceae bacterium]
MSNINNQNGGFDPMAWANRTNENMKPATPKEVAQPSFNDNELTPAQVQCVVNRLVNGNIDITDDYNDWLHIGFALADELGESGRSAYHDVSRMSSKYNPTDCDKQYDACLRSNKQGVTISTFFHMAKQAGVDISEVAREVCAKNAKMPIGTNSEKVAKTTDFTVFDGIVPDGTLAQLAQNTFSDKLMREDIPSYLYSVIDSQSDAAGRDKMLLGTLNVISGLIPYSLYSIYDRKKVFAPLYNIIYGRFATSKGDLEAVKQIAMPIKLEMRRKYEYEKSEYEAQMLEWEGKNKKERGPQPKEPTLRSPFVTANSSASAVYRGLDANEGWGIMFETEADTLTNMLSKAEYGDYSDLLRKAHHHESCPFVRVSEHINIELEKPRLSVFLTGTGSQLPALLPANNVSNGLASRFLFYALPDSKLEFRDVFAGCDEPIEDIYRRLGERFMPMYHALLMREQHPIQFIMSKAQQKEFLDTFDAVLREQFAMLGDGIQGFIFRIALECFRYAMILTVLRRLSEWDEQDSIFDDDEQALVCDDRDFHSAMTIINCLINHTGRVYAVLGTKDNDPFSKLAEQPSAELKSFYKALPDGEIRTSGAVEIAKSLRMSERTAKRMLGDMVAKFQVLGHPRQGIYIKSSVQES